MVHPLHPASPQYAELVEAGRAPAGGYPWPRIERDPLACVYEYEDRYGPVVCGQPACTVVGRSDGAGVTSRYCDRDATLVGKALPWTPDVSWIVVRFACSVCDADATYRSQLDASGRCDSCRP